MLYAAGYRNAAPDDEWSYSFSGLAGSLDHVLLNGPARSRLTGADIWNVNSGESPALEYSTYKMTSTDLYAPDAKRPPITTRWWSATAGADGWLSGRLQQERPAPRWSRSTPRAVAAGSQSRRR